MKIEIDISDELYAEYLRLNRKIKELDEQTTPNLSPVGMELTQLQRDIDRTKTEFNTMIANEVIPSQVFLKNMMWMHKRRLELEAAYKKTSDDYGNNVRKIKYELEHDLLSIRRQLRDTTTYPKEYAELLDKIFETELWRDSEY